MTNKELNEAMTEHTISSNAMARVLGIHHSLVTRYRNDEAQIPVGMGLVFDFIFKNKKVPTITLLKAVTGKKY